MVVALPDIIAICVLLVAIGLISMGQQFIAFLNWVIQTTVGKIPFVGSLVGGAAEDAFQFLSSQLGSAAGALEGYLGACFGLLAGMVEWVGKLIASSLLFDARMAEVLVKHGVQIVTHDITDTIHTATDTIVKQSVTDVHTVTRVADTATRAAVAGLTGTVGTLGHDISDVLEPTIEGVRARVKELEDASIRTWNLLRQHEEALAIGAVTAAVAVAVDELGATWIRCDKNGALGRQMCGLPQGLFGDLLAALAVVAAGTFTLEELARWLQGSIKDIEPAIAQFWAASVKGAGGNPSLGMTGL